MIGPPCMCGLLKRAAPRLQQSGSSSTAATLRHFDQ